MPPKNGLPETSSETAEVSFGTSDAPLPISKDYFNDGNFPYLWIWHGTSTATERNGMAKKDKAQPQQPGNGPYHWGNGPKKQSLIIRIVKKLAKGSK
jgi:hypothetical protein